MEDELIPLAGLATLTLAAVGDRARMGVEGLAARAAGVPAFDDARGDIGRWEEA